MPPPGLLPPPGMLPPGAPPFPPGVSRPPLPPPTFVPAGSSLPVPTSTNGAPTPSTGSVTPAVVASQPLTSSPPPPLVLPNPALEQKYGPFKKKTDLKYADSNFSPVRTVFFKFSHLVCFGLCSPVFPSSPPCAHTYRKRSVHVPQGTILPSMQRIQQYHKFKPPVARRSFAGGNAPAQRTSSSCICAYACLPTKAKWEGWCLVRSYRYFRWVILCGSLRSLSFYLSS
ncbi:hypothetical protein F5141DRAFT_211569 [Pisolithus sp. B1]|nr:hypothetical protein F5141DRAFT_211569 [Pisolithus sp. B1]